MCDGIRAAPRSPSASPAPTAISVCGSRTPSPWEPCRLPSCRVRSWNVRLPWEAARASSDLQTTAPWSWSTSLCSQSHTMTTPPALPIRVLIVDDHAVMRMGLRLLFEGQPDLLVVGEAATGAEALAAATGVAPDVIVLDLDLGGENGSDSIPALRAAAPGARVLILTGVRDPDLSRQAMRHGAIGLVRKEQAARVL